MGIQDYTADLSSARRARLDVRRAELEAELASLDEKRKSYGAEAAPKRSRAKKSDD